MRIIQLISGTGLNGAIRHCSELTRLLAERGHDVLLAHKPGAWIAQQSYPKQVRTVETSLKRYPSELKRMAAIAREFQCDVVHSHLSSAHFFGVLLTRIFGLRSVATSHMTFLQPHWWWNDRVIAPSSQTARFQHWVNWVPYRRIDVVPNFIDTNKFKPQRDRASTRSELSVNSKSFLITVIGEVSARKAPHVLVQALPELIARGIKPHVFLVGHILPDYQATITREIERLGLGHCVALLGIRNDVADLLAASDCCCLPSNREVMPISLLEAMSLGLPAVATKVGGVPECIRDGRDGFLVPPRNPRALAAALTKLALDPALRLSMGQSAKAQMEAAFSPAACLPLIEQAYQRACRQNPLRISGDSTGGQFRKVA